MTETATLTPDQLATQAAQAEAIAAEARAELERRAAAEHDRQTALIHANAQAVIDVYDDREAALQGEEKTAQRAWQQAVLNSDIGKAFIAYRSQRFRRMNLRDEMNLALNVLGEDRRVPELAYRDPRLLEDLVAFLERESNAVAGDEHDEHMQALQDPA